MLSKLKLIFKLPKKILIPLLIGLIILIYFLFFRSNGEIKPEFVQVKRADIKQTVSASGILTGKNNVNLRFKNGGKISSINIKEGDIVTKGMILASLDTKDLEIALQQARNTYGAKKATTDRIEDDLKDHASDETLTQRETRMKAQADSNSAFDAVKAAQRAFEDAVIISPISGVVTKVPFLVGQITSPTDTVLQVVDFTEIVFETDVDESDISKIKIGQTTEITLNAYPDQFFSGSVSNIEPATKTSTNGATTVTIKITFNNQNLTPISGLNGQVVIVTDQRSSALTIPQDALKEENLVIVQTSQGLEERNILLGIKSDTDVEVTSGLQEGEQVVTNPQSIKLNRSKSWF